MYRLTKISDDKFGGQHPNFIFEGYSVKGHFKNPPKVGERFYFGTIKDHPREHLDTSTVTEIINDELFKTKNSTYKLEKL